MRGDHNDSRNLARTWDKPGPDERRIILDHWLVGELIVVEPISGMLPANRKTALVRLRSAQNAPRTWSSSRFSAGIERCQELGAYDDVILRAQTGAECGRRGREAKPAKRPSRVRA